MGNIQEARPMAEAAQGIAHIATRYGLDIAAVLCPVTSVNGNIVNMKIMEGAHQTRIIENARLNPI